MDIFQKNIKALKQTNSPIVEKLLEIQTNKIFEVFVEDSLENANILDARDASPIYHDKPIVEMEKKLKSYEKKKYYTALYNYGIGNGHLAKRLLLNHHLRTLYIFEPEIELIYVALNLVDFSQDISNDRLKILTSELAISAFLASWIKGIDQVYFKTYDLDVHSNFYEKYHEDIITLNKEIMKTFSYYVTSTGNDVTDELLGLEHLVQNLPLMLKNPTFENLKQKAKTTNTAIIVATGPSLAKQLPLLKKIKEHVTIISVDASLPILEKEGIKPDIVTSIERIALTGKFYEQTSKEFHKDIVFALTAIVDKELLKNIKDGQLQLNMRPVGTHYYYLDIDEYGYAGIGMSAANLAYEIASHIGFDNIVLIGQDLAYGKDGSSHSKNHIFGEDEVKQNDKKDDYIEAYGGDGKVKTTWVWKLFLSGYEKVIAYNNKESSIKTINATQGGARIQGTIEMEFSKVAQELVNIKQKKQKIILDKPSNEEIAHNLKKISQKLQRAEEMGYEMHKQTKKLLKEITQIIRKYQKYDKNKIEKYAKEKELKKLVDKIVKVRNSYYGGEFESFYGLLISPLLSHLEYEIAYWTVQPETSARARVHKNWNMILFHHEWCMRVMLNLEAILKILQENTIKETVS